MNGSYGYDGMNTEKFAKIKICSRDKTFQNIIYENYVSGIKLSDDNYLLQMNPKSFKCTTCLQESFWTLDNAKFWYLTFIYDFMYKCMDVNRFHFIEGDTDSAYWAIAGDEHKPPTQLFDNIITNREFYDNNVYKFMPNPNINTIADEKKILGCAIEKYGENMIALAPKCYTIFNNDNITKALKLKGVSLKKNKITKEDYEDIIANGGVKVGKNINLQMVNCGKSNNKITEMKMSKITVNKNALTGTHTKMIVLENNSCAPYINGLTANNYIIENCEN